MLIEVLGPGCRRCVETEQNVREALKASGIAADVTHITDVRTMVERRVMFTPAVAIDGVVKLAGKVPTVPEVVKVLTNHLAANEAGGTINYAAYKQERK